jgi:hypothetical protein
MTYERDRSRGSIQLKVRLDLESFRLGDDDDACRLMGAFRRKAREQGWPEADIEAVSRQVAGSRVHHELGPYIDPTGPEPLSWRTQLDRNRDYVEGFRMFAGDEAIKPRPLRFLARGLKVALRGASR